MTEPTITCPNCRTQIKLTESLAAPLIEATRHQYEQQLAQKDANIAQREVAIREQQAEIAKARQSIESAVAARVSAERGRIAEEEAQKAQRMVATDLEQKTKEVAELNEVLKIRKDKLAAIGAGNTFADD